MRPLPSIAAFAAVLLFTSDVCVAETITRVTSFYPIEPNFDFTCDMYSSAKPRSFQVIGQSRQISDRVSDDKLQIAIKARFSKSAYPKIDEIVESDRQRQDGLKVLRMTGNVMQEFGLLLPLEIDEKSGVMWIRLAPPGDSAFVASGVCSVVKSKEAK